MNNEILINIDGWFAGGKSALWSLLDSHPDIFVCPIHDFSHSIILSQSDQDEWLEKRHLSMFRKILSRSEYYKFEKQFHDKKIEIYLSTSEVIELNHHTDFYQFDRHFIKQIQALKSWSTQEIALTLYRSFMQIHNKEHQAKIYASMSHPKYHNHYERMANQSSRVKSILVKRDIRNIVATRCNRKTREKDLNEHMALRTPFNKIVESGEIQQIQYFYAHYDLLAQTYPEQFKVITLTELLNETEVTMRSVSEFIGIPFSDVLTKPTMNGIPLVKNGLSFIGQENDNYLTLLSHEEIEIINKIIASNGSHASTKNNQKNMDFSININKILKQTAQLIATQEKTVLYGNGNITSFIVSKFPHVKFIIADKYHPVETDGNGDLIHPTQLKHLAFDKIIITVLGRESEVLDYLVNYLEIDKEKTFSFELK